MTNFLTAEFSKILKRKKFYLGMMLVILASISNILIYILFNKNYADISNSTLQYLLMRLISNQFVAILIVFIVTVLLAGTNGSTAKNAITIGYSRPQIYFGKLIVGTIIMLIIILVSMITTFIFAGIWLYRAMTIAAIWEALVRYSLLILVYTSLFVISLTLCYVISYNTVFAVIYFILFLVFAEVIEVLSRYESIATIAQLTPTHQFNELIYTHYFKELWIYIVGSFVAYIATSVALGLVVVNRKDIR